MGAHLKFCMVTTFYPPYNFGGDGMYIYRLANELGKRGHTVDVVHCKDAFLLLQPDGPKGNFPNHPNVSLFSLKSRWGILSPLLTQQTGRPGLKSKSLKKRLEDNDYDVIHYHNMSLIGISALGYGTGIKLYTMHEHWLVCPMHVLWKNNREVCQTRNCFSCSLAFRRPPQIWRAFGTIDKMLKHVDHCISPSRFTKQKHQELGIMAPIRHIPYFLPEKKKDETGDRDRSVVPHEIPHRKNEYFLFVGRLEVIKGVQKIIPVFRKRKEYNLVIVGDGTYENELKKMAKDTPNIHFLGRLGYEELISLYRNALAVVVPSICYEVFGIIIIEAFSVKTPVIVNNLGALPEVVEESGGGFCYNTEKDFERALDTVSRNPGVRKELGEKGYASYLRNWTEKNHLKLYLELIQELREKRDGQKGALSCAL